MYANVHLAEGICRNGPVSEAVDFHHLPDMWPVVCKVRESAPCLCRSIANQPLPDVVLYLYAIPVVIIEYNRDQNDQGAGLRQVHISRMLCIYGIGGGVHKIHNKYTFEPTFSIGTVPSTALPPSPTTVFSWPHVNNSTAHSSGGCIDSAAGWCSIRTLGYAILDLGP